MVYNLEEPLAKKFKNEIDEKAMDSIDDLDNEIRLSGSRYMGAEDYVIERINSHIQASRVKTDCSIAKCNFAKSELSLDWVCTPNDRARTAFKALLEQRTRKTLLYVGDIEDAYVGDMEDFVRRFVDRRIFIQATTTELFCFINMCCLILAAPFFLKVVVCSCEDIPSRTLSSVEYEQGFCQSYCSSASTFIDYLGSKLVG